MERKRQRKKGQNLCKKIPLALVCIQSIPSIIKAPQILVYVSVKNRIYMAQRQQFVMEVNYIDTNAWLVLILSAPKGWATKMRWNAACWLFCQFNSEYRNGLPFWIMSDLYRLLGACIYVCWFTVLFQIYLFGYIWLYVYFYS